MCHGKGCELQKTDDSQTSNPETNNALYVNFLKNQEGKHDPRKTTTNK